MYVCVCVYTCLYVCVHVCVSVLKDAGVLTTVLN